MTAKMKPSVVSPSQEPKAVKHDHNMPPRKTTTKKRQPKPSVRPKEVKITKSKIKNVGLGLYLLEDVKVGEFVTRYSGEVIDAIENNNRTSHYRIKISGNLYLDAEKIQHFEGRFINDGVRAGIKPNVRFVSGYRTNK